MVGVLHNRNENLSYGTCSKYLGFPCYTFPLKVHWTGSMDWFLYNNGLSHERIKGFRIQVPVIQSFH